MSKNAFVTGATGLLGTNLVRDLMREGWKVKALARSRPKFERLFPGNEVEPVTGDMEDVAGFATALQGCDFSEQDPGRASAVRVVGIASCASCLDIARLDVRAI